MGIIAKEKSGGGNFKPIEAGIHDAVCDMVVDRGEIDTSYGPKHKVYIRFQLPAERVTFEDGTEKPAIIGKSFTLSLSEKATLRGFLENWRGKPFTQEEKEGFDVTNLLGKPATLVIGHYTDKQSGDIRSGINSVTRCRTTPPPEVEGEALWATADSSVAVLSKLPKWLQEDLGYHEDVARTAESDNASTQQSQDLEDDIPF